MNFLLLFYYSIQHCISTTYSSQQNVSLEYQKKCAHKLFELRSLKFLSFFNVCYVGSSSHSMGFYPPTLSPNHPTKGFVAKPCSGD